MVEVEKSHPTIVGRLGLATMIKKAVVRESIAKKPRNMTKSHDGINQDVESSSTNSERSVMSFIPERKRVSTPRWKQDQLMVNIIWCVQDRIWIDYSTKDQMFRLEANTKLKPKFEAKILGAIKILINIKDFQK